MIAKPKNRPIPVLPNIEEITAEGRKEGWSSGRDTVETQAEMPAGDLCPYNVSWKHPNYLVGGIYSCAWMVESFTHALFDFSDQHVHSLAPVGISLKKNKSTF